jgi:hypothetical protein
VTPALRNAVKSKPKGHQKLINQKKGHLCPYSFDYNFEIIPKIENKEN